ncbi:uncharacterized protein LOC121249423 [Juglans microcarpa x Juglans regia]|uniref:uncharacterized protein LOC121249423 n=1 Tax=Juglans microcarpa x Juglans regia TaxID=2249226 RepID=UPI001B7EE0BE|nr:uncharacterized protein LOC121249423 [Juglans microcarpa x Juglans regia]
MGDGVVIRDSNSSVQAVLTFYKDHISSALQTKRMALLRAMELCSELGFNQICFEGDAKLVVDAVNTKQVDNSWLGQLTEDIQQIIKYNQACCLNFAYRSENKAAYTVAKLAIRNDKETIWLEEGPLEVLNIVQGDSFMYDIIVS